MGSQNQFNSPGCEDFTRAAVVTRAGLEESIHFAAGAVVDPHGNLLAWLGNPHLVTFMRSSSKPLQALPLIENGGVELFDLTGPEIALMCASHEGTDMHLKILQSLQSKTGIMETDLLCGTHPVSDRATAEAMLLHGEKPTPNRHNCSGKHTGFLVQALLQHLSKDHYIDPEHPVQQAVLQTFAEMVGMDHNEILIGVDGCSAPVFALPLYHAALGIARLCDPDGLKPARAQACRTITSAMSQHPEMVAGFGQFDTRLMQVGQGQIITKRGAEGFQIIGVMPGAIGPSSPALGIALKVADGDLKERARPAISLELLRQLKALPPESLRQLAEFDARPLYNYRKIEIGNLSTVFHLTTQAEQPLQLS